MKKLLILLIVLCLFLSSCGSSDDTIKFEQLSLNVLPSENNTKLDALKLEDAYYVSLTDLRYVLKNTNFNFNIKPTMNFIELIVEEYDYITHENSKLFKKEFESISSEDLSEPNEIVVSFYVSGDAHPVRGIALNNKAFFAIDELSDLIGFHAEVSDDNTIIFDVAEIPNNSLSNNRDYDWYIDQGKTGRASDNNCGPSSAVMAEKWYNKETTMTAEKAREEHPENWGWWSTVTIAKYLNSRNVPFEEIVYLKPNDIKNELDKGKIIILCIDTTYIDYDNFSKNNTGRFYTYQGGHFLIVKGYRTLKDKLYWEVYDPNNFGLCNADGTPMGKDRLYSAENMDTAIKKWWNIMMIIDTPKSN